MSPQTSDMSKTHYYLVYYMPDSMGGVIVLVLLHNVHVSVLNKMSYFLPYLYTRTLMCGCVCGGGYKWNGH